MMILVIAFVLINAALGGALAPVVVIGFLVWIGWSLLVNANQSSLYAACAALPTTARTCHRCGQYCAPAHVGQHRTIYRCGCGHRWAARR